MLITIDQTIDAKKSNKQDASQNGMDNIEPIVTDELSDTVDSGNQTMKATNWHIYDNPLLNLCDIGEFNTRGPPLFAIRFPDLFVY